MRFTERFPLRLEYWLKRLSPPGERLLSGVSVVAAAGLFAHFFWQLPLPLPAPAFFAREAVQPVANRLAEAWSEENAPSPEATAASLDLRLIGLYSDPQGKSIALIQRDGESKPWLLLAGQGHASGLSLLEARKNSVVLADEGRKIELALPRTERPASAGPVSPRDSNSWTAHAPLKD